MSLYYRKKEGLLVDAWILSSQLEEVLSRIGSMSLPTTKLHLEFFEQLDAGFVRGIAGWTQLETLDLLRCTSDPGTVKDLVRDLASKPALRHLSLTRMNSMGDGSIFEGLVSLSSLECLDLCGTPCGTGLVLPLKHIIASTSSLKNLDITHTNIETDGLAELMGVLAKNKTVARLAVGGIPRADEVLLNIFEKDNCTLQVVDGLACNNPCSPAVQFFCELNKAGRLRFRDVNAGKCECIDTLAASTNELSIVYGLLRENPAKWA
jgi:hypothetical protein